MIRFRENNLYGIQDQNGNEVVPAKYEDIGNFYDGLAEVELNGKWGFIDTEGKEIIPPKYDLIGNFYDGLARVELNGKWGFIDTEGKEIIPPKYDLVGNFYDGLARVELNGKWGFIDTEGNEIWGSDEKQAFLNTLTVIPCYVGLFAFLVEHEGSVEDYFANHPRGEKAKKWCDEHKRS